MAGGDEGLLGTAIPAAAVAGRGVGIEAERENCGSDDGGGAGDGLPVALTLLGVPDDATDITNAPPPENPPPPTTAGLPGERGEVTPSPLVRGEAFLAEGTAVGAEAEAMSFTEGGTHPLGLVSPCPLGLLGPGCPLGPASPICPPELLGPCCPLGLLIPGCPLGPIGPGCPLGAFLSLLSPEG